MHISEFVKTVMKSFSGSFINSDEELILVRESNLFIKRIDVDDLAIKAALLEQCSRDACISEPLECGNAAYQDRVRTNLNEIFGMDWNRKEMRLIYRRLGNSVDHQLTLDFIESNYDLTILDYKGQLDLF